MTASEVFTRRFAIPLTEKQYEVLSILREGKNKDQALVRLDIKDRFDERSLKIMQMRDLIVESRKVFEGERRFMITSRGLKLLAQFESRGVRANAAEDVCYLCGKAPRYVSPGGWENAYCLDCHNAYQKTRYAARRVNKPDRPCVTCGSAPRHVWKSGKKESYCKQCLNEHARIRRERYREKARVPS